DLTVLPVLDTTAHHAGTAYTAPVTLKRHLAERDRHCLFPFCDRPARACDCDHVVPHGERGPTCSCNTIPLCRHHHRLKTHAGYTLSLVEPGVAWWTTPWGHQFTVTRDGTVPVTTSAHRAPPRPVCLN
ncbi:MAG: HNH endonuclease signature motif containing protein, partial [Marmoricola sp.]